VVAATAGGGSSGVAAAATAAAARRFSTVARWRSQRWWCGGRYESRSQTKTKFRGFAHLKVYVRYQGGAIAEDHDGGFAAVGDRRPRLGERESPEVVPFSQAGTRSAFNARSVIRTPIYLKHLSAGERDRGDKRGIS